MMTSDLREPMYTEEFFRNILPGSMRSAAGIVPLLVDWIKPRSVVDVGCGVGTWTAAFRDAGIGDYLGVDGDYADTQYMQIERDRFLARDLTEPLDLGRRFDLAISMEVAEHLPETAADTFVASLAALSDTIAFSAARPRQGGRHHVNEQPPGYWAKKFGALGYDTFDCLRPLLWMRDDVEWWYRQNILLFSRSPTVTQDPAVAAARRAPGDPMLDIVHPSGFEFRVDKLTGRIDELHASYKKRIQEAKAEVWAKKADAPADETYKDVWDKYLVETYPGIKQRRNARAKRGSEPLIEWGGDEWGSRSIVDPIVEETFPLPPTDTPLVFVEIGGGAGRFTVPILRRHPKARLLAFDVSPAYLKALDERLESEGLSERASLHRLNEDPDAMGRAIAARGLVGQVDVLFSYDAMVHVDLPTQTVYFMTAGLALKPGGSIVMSVADPVTEQGAAMLFRSSRRIYAEMGRPSVKFIYMSQDIIRSTLERLGFETAFKTGNDRDCFFVAKLVDPAKARAAAIAAGFPEQWQ